MKLLMEVALWCFSLVFKKYLVALFLIMIYASASLAAANDPGLFSAMTMHPTNDSPKNISVEINSDCFAGYFTKFTSLSTDLEHMDMPISWVSECFEETSTITLHKDGDKIIWGLAPSLSRYSLNPIDDIRNIQVLLRYRF
jgi:hypothetical protein